jgi:hypothetical protein
MRAIITRLKREALQQGRTILELLEPALCLLFGSQRDKRTLPSLPTFRSGAHLVDIADRDSLYRAMEGW